MAAAPSQSTLFYEQGKLCYQQKKFEEAIEQFTEAIKCKPDTPQVQLRACGRRGHGHGWMHAGWCMRV